MYIYIYIHIYTYVFFFVACFKLSGTSFRTKSFKKFWKFNHRFSQNFGLDTFHDPKRPSACSSWGENLNLNFQVEEFDCLVMFFGMRCIEKIE